MEMIPKTAMSIFFPSSEDLKYVGFNCGDLIFSGHMYTNVLSCYYFATYTKRVCTKPGWGLASKNVRLCLLALDLGCLIASAVCILVSRQHYTVDVVLATYIGLLLPYWYEDNLAPMEIDPFQNGGRCANNDLNDNGVSNDDNQELVGITPGSAPSIAQDTVS